MAYNNNSNPTPDARTASTTYPATGTGAWTSGFVAYIPIPLLNSVIAGIVMMVIGLGQRKKGGVAAQNGANAANWGVLQIVIPVIFFATMTIGLLAGEKTETGVRMHGGMGAALVVIGILWFLSCIAHLVVIIVGIVKSRRGEVLRIPLKIFKAPQQ